MSSEDRPIIDEDGLCVFDTGLDLIGPIVPTAALCIVAWIDEQGRSRWSFHNRGDIGGSELIGLIERVKLAHVASLDFQFWGEMHEEHNGEDD